MNEVKRIQFEGGELLGVRAEDGKVYLGVKKACLDIGLSERQARLQVENIQKDIVLCEGVRNFGLPTKGGEQEVCCLCEKLVTLWLAKISLTPNMRKTNPQAVQKLLTYQLKAADALHAAFMETEEQRQTLFNELGIEGKIVDMEQSLAEMKSSIDRLIDQSTINHRQAQKILTAGKERISELLGGARSARYRTEARIYFKNMWNQFAERFGVSTYKDLSPANMGDGFEFIKNWRYA